jgi:hypothetical protein
MLIKPSAIVLSLFLTSAYAESDPTSLNVQQRCHSIGAPSLDDPLIDRIQTSLKYFVQVLPNVPPEENLYLQAESQSVFKAYDEEAAQNTSQKVANARFATLSARPLYYVWKARADLSRAITDVDLVLVNVERANKTGLEYQSNEANKLHRAAESLSDLSDLQQSLSEFINHDGALGNPLLSDQQKTSISERQVRLITTMAFFIQCKLAKIAPAKKL